MENRLKRILDRVENKEPTKILMYRGRVINLCSGVYEPSDESYFLADNLEIYKGERALDIGTGTGILSLILSDKASRVIATDISENALKCARGNANLNSITNIEFRRGSLFEPVKGETFDLIVSNTPHVPAPIISRNEYVRLNVDGGPDGRIFIDRIIEQANEHLNQGGRIQLVQSEVANLKKTLEGFSKNNLSPEITAGKIEPFGRTGSERIEYFKSLGINFEYDGETPLEKNYVITARKK